MSVVHSFLSLNNIPTASVKPFLKAYVYILVHIQKLEGRLISSEEQGRSRFRIGFYSLDLTECD